MKLLSPKALGFIKFFSHVGEYDLVGQVHLTTLLGMLDRDKLCLDF